MRSTSTIDVPHVHMTGSEWFGARPGGLNRYFSSLYEALGRREDLTVSACSFGIPPGGGSSWGPPGGSLARRVLKSRVPVPATADLVDRHFALYGRPPRRGVPLLVHFQGPWAGESQAAGHSQLAVRAKKAVERSRYKQAQTFVVLSQRFADLLQDTYGVDPGSISIIPPGVDLERFRPGEPPQGANVLCVRRLERRMGVDVLLEAWPAVVDAVPEATLTVVGSGTYERRLRQLAQELPTVDFRGRLSDEELLQHYHSCTVTVVPSIALEGFGLIALESLAAGRAPVLTDCGGLPDAVRRLDDSLIVPASDATALAGRLVSALQGQRPGAGECRAHAETFSWELIAGRHTALYLNLLG